MSELRAFVSERAGEKGWKQIAESAGLADRSYLPMGAYPDEEALSLVSVACKHLALDPATVLHAFGRHLVRPLVETYGALLKPTWKSLDVLEHTERMVHSVVRRTTPGAQPPTLAATRVGPDEVILQYRSARRMCHVAMGIAEGLGDVFSESLDVSQRRCMLEGDPECQLVIRRRPPSGKQRKPVE